VSFLTQPGAPTDTELYGALAELLARAGAGGGVGEPLELRRVDVPQRSTFPLERLHVRLRGGQRMQIAFKRLEWAGLTADARRSRPAFAFEPAREPAVYASLLPLAPAGPPRLLGSLPSESGRGRWLFLEWVQGRELHQIGSRALWGQAARWLAQLHVALADDLERHAREAGLIRHDAAHCIRWAERAVEFADGVAGDRSGARFLRRLPSRYGAVVEELLDLPQTVIHGDFYASNVLVSEVPAACPDGRPAAEPRVTPGGWPAGGQCAAPGGRHSAEPRVAPVDWEMAAVGSGLMDLAALISGDWSGAEREAMRAAYAAVDGVPAFSSRQLDLARLHHAVQRLGWAPPGWRPPRSQRHDWLTEAIMLVETLGV
jgi:aminoglycoside phosphotransferase (APT) family kinase protein